MRKLDRAIPGELFLEESLALPGISQHRPAGEIDVPVQPIGEIVPGKRAVAADRAVAAGTDRRLCRVFSLPSGCRLRTQAAHDTEVVARELGTVLERIKPRAAGATAQHGAAVALSRRR